jgi:1-aminocyclopropane-1-carboxylate deaminase/D-cysteine desulfhydrase-like pyridoxal-dependent ACC family enzyme
MRGLIDLIESKELTADHRVLFIHLGGGPAVHAYGNLLFDGHFRELEA